MVHGNLVLNVVWEAVVMTLRVLCFISLLTCSTLYTPTVYATQNTSAQQSFTSAKALTLRTMIAKLRELIYNLRDINELEEIGMPKADVLLMKTALQEKVNQVQGETLVFIRSL